MFGILLPTRIAHTKRIDKIDSNTLWYDAISKDMTNVRIAFAEFDKSFSDILPGYKKLNCHIIFEVKISENFRRKALFVADGYLTNKSSSFVYSTVNSRNSARVAFVVAVLNDLKILTSAIQNKYLATPL